MKRYTQRNFALLLVSLFVIQLAGCSASAGLKPSETACELYLQKMQQNQFGAAYNLLSLHTQSLTNGQQLQNYWALVEKNKGKVQSWSQTGTQLYSGTGGNSVRLTYDLVCNSGSATVTFSCAEEKGKWVIEGFNFNA